MLQKICEIFRRLFLSHDSRDYWHKGSIQSARDNFYILLHFLFICARLFCIHTCIRARTHTYTHTYAYACPVDFAYQRLVCSRNVARPETRSFELGFSQLYTRHTVSRCPPSLHVSVSHLISLILSFVSVTRADLHNRTGDAGAFTNCAHSSRTCDHLCAHLETNVENTVIIVIIAVSPPRWTARRSIINRQFSKN